MAVQTATITHLYLGSSSSIQKIKILGMQDAIILPVGNGTGYKNCTSVRLKISGRFLPRNTSSITINIKERTILEKQGVDS